MAAQRSRSNDRTYELIDSGGCRKLERFGPYHIVRPCAQAIWTQRKDSALWDHADAVFERRKGYHWHFTTALPQSWDITVEGITFRLSTTDFGHLGIFPEQRTLWTWIRERVKQAIKKPADPISVLNLFAYSGGATLAAALEGARVCHLDASKGMVRWAKENAALNGLSSAPIRWIVDDVNRFLDRELRRGRRYDAIVLDPPTYGHGKNKEVYKIERELTSTVQKCWLLLTDRPLFMILTSHTPACSPVGLNNILTSTAGTTQPLHLECGEMLLTGDSSVLPVPSGTYCRWVPEDVNSNQT
ncbi:MAG: class I SAM-dependent methyltransferase [Desulfomonilia bacterium]